MKGIKLFQEAQFFAIQGLKFFLTLILLILNPVLSHAFDSGSTGADGPFAPSANTTLTLPPNGIFNFTTVNIPSGVTVTFQKNTTNTSVVILATGNVTISGTFDVSGEDAAPAGTAGNGDVTDDGDPGAGGPGGFAGGRGGLGGGFGGSLGSIGSDGLGPGGGGYGNGIGAPPNAFPISGGGGGFATPGERRRDSNTNILSGVGGVAYGTTRLLPLVGGSGGGGGAGGSGFNGAGGGGGGGSVLIASSGNISVNGSINADGGLRGLSQGSGRGGEGGSASGGAIRLLANVILGNGALFARGGAGHTTSNSLGGGAGGDGRISLEAINITFSGNSQPSFLPGTPGQIFPPGLPTLAITDIGGVTAPASPAGSFSTLDITLPIGTTSPVIVSLAATNIPVTTIIQIKRFRELGTSGTFNSTGLAGTDASSTATASVSMGSGIPYVLQASATFTVTVASNPFPVFVQGERVKQVRVAATFGGPSSIFLITESGREVPYQGVLSE